MYGDDRGRPPRGAGTGSRASDRPRELVAPTHWAMSSRSFLIPSRRKTRLFR
jgi:hypothetical protein